MDRNSVTRALHEVLETQVINHGDYSLVYAEPSGPGPALVLGYRSTPLELVLCPVRLLELPLISGDDRRMMAVPAGPVSSIDLSNVGILADTGTGYQVETVTGFRAAFEVEDVLRAVVDASRTAHADATVEVEQAEAAESFHEFMDHFMDVLDGFYRVPDDTEGLQDTYNPPVAA